MFRMSLDNILSFDEYIGTNIRRIIEAEQAEHSGKGTVNKDKGPQTTSSFLSLPNGYIYNINGKNDKYWTDKAQSCELQLIGTPEDVEDLSMIPGILIKDVFDDTQSFFIFDEDYSYPELQSSIIFNIFEVFKEYLNPDERIYSIYIHMSDELIKSIYYGKSNFFFTDDKPTQKRTSIKNFIKYLSYNFLKK